MEYVRICPVCETVNPAEQLVCVCGAMLAGVDYTLKAPAVAQPETAETAPPAVTSTSTQLCPYPDCGQPNHPGEARCLYCNRPLQAEAAGHRGKAYLLEAGPGTGKTTTIAERIRLLAARLKPKARILALQ